MSLHKPTVFQGVATALITPFCDGGIDYTSLDRMIELQIRAGVGAILVAGTTGEGSTLSFDEHGELIAHAAKTVSGRLPLLAGCGSNCTERACELARIACRAGADALLSVTPYYNKTSDAGILLHYKAIAEASSRPIIVYNVPSRTGFRMTIKHYRELAKLDRIVGVKEASGDLSLLETLCADCGELLDIYTGNDDQTVAAYKLGGSGVISVCSNLVPARMVELCRLCSEGDYKRASKRMRRLQPLISELFCEVNPIPVKYMASQMGLCAPLYRLPLCPPSPDTRRRLEELLPSLLG